MKSQSEGKGCIGVLCGGGPAPGFNSVICSIVIEAEEKGYKVVGFKEGFKFIQTGRVKEENYMIFKTKKVSRIIYQGGTIIRTSRANPKKYNVKKPEEGFLNCIKVFEKLNVQYLITIGGDDTCSSSKRLYDLSKGKLRVCHVPKTIDNDVPLPGDCVTFGFHTARELGAHIVFNLMTDAECYSRFFIITSMGRKAGHLALGIGKGSSAHLCLIPEEFTAKGNKYVSFKKVCDVIEGFIIKRKYLGKDHGAIVLAEGLIEYMNEKDVIKLFGKENIHYDQHDHIRLELLDFEEKIKEELEKRTKKRGIKASFTAKKLGYELRCERPNCYDRIYTRDLGYCAVTHVLNNKHGVLMTIQNSRGVGIPFEKIPVDKNGKAVIRTVDVKGEYFKCARAYMIRLKKKDFTEKKRMEELSKVGKFKSVEEYLKYFDDVRKDEMKEF